MNHSVVLNRYIKALIAVIKSKNEEVVPLLTHIQTYIDHWLSHPLLPSFLENPLCSLAIKKKTLSLLLKDETNPMINHFFYTVAKNKRLNQLASLSHCIKEVIQSIQQTESVTILTASHLDSSHQQKLSQLANQFSTSTIKASFIQDKSILGGFKLNFRDKVVDGSIDYNLKRLQTQFKGEKKLC